MIPHEIVSRRGAHRIFAVVLAFTVSIPFAAAQSGGASLPDPPDTVSLRNMPKHLLKDQEAIWTSPARLRESNALGAIVLALGTTVLITTDHQVMSSSKLNNASLNSHAETASNGLSGGFVAMPVVLYGMGRLIHDDHAAETGLLGGEAMVDSYAVNQVFKGISRRERPTVDGARGKFFQSNVGFDSSFASNHAAVAWSSAAVIASEYNARMTQVTVYGLATGVSLTRVLARQHFPSDVLVGSAVGWLVGRYVDRRYSDASGGSRFDRAMMKVAEIIQ